jgi:uncharacterized damage-inducible protein DinB
MKNLLSSFAAYEYWANRRLLAVVLNLSEEQQQQEVESSFSTVYRTCLHVWDASTIWWQRLHQLEQIVVPSLSFHPTMIDVNNGLLAQNRQWIDWIEAASDETLTRQLPYKNMKGESFIQPVNEILLHLSNHGTYHRGQLVTQLRQVGAEAIPATDYILFARS